MGGEEEVEKSEEKSTPMSSEEGVASHEAYQGGRSSFLRRRERKLSSEDGFSGVSGGGGPSLRETGG